MNLVSYNELLRIFSQGNMTLTEDQYDRFRIYAERLCKESERMNLTAVTDPVGIAIKHFYDSVYPFTLIDVPHGTMLIDVGSGAGFPSVPLAVMRPDVRLTLLDSLNKRIGFLKTLTETLGVSACCVHGRAEELSRPGQPLRESFDIAAARAVANLGTLCEYCLPFVKVGGVFAALKGSEPDDEIAAAQNSVKILGGEIEKTLSYRLPNGDGRTLILIRKLCGTDEKYPRNSARIKKKPL